MRCLTSLVFAVGGYLASATPQHRLAYMAYTTDSLGRHAALMLADGVEVDPSAPPPTITEFVPLGGGTKGTGQAATSPDGTQIALVSWKTTTKCEINPPPQHEVSWLKCEQTK